MEVSKNNIELMLRYEDRMRTAVYSNYSRNINSIDLEKLRQIYNSVKGIDYRLNKSCSTCQLNFLKLIGRWWFDNRETLLKEVDEPEPILNINELEKVVTNNETKPKKCQKKRKQGNNG